MLGLCLVFFFGFGMGFTEFRGASVTSLVCRAFLWHMSVLACVPAPKSYRGSPDVSCRVSRVPKVCLLGERCSGFLVVG